MTRQVNVLPGDRYGKLTALHETKPEVNAVRSMRRWVFKCDCGSTKTLRLSHVRAGVIASCGCGQPGTTHGHAKSSGWSGTYHTWKCMRARCTNPRMSGYRYYGGLGIKVCDRWRDSFDAFLADMGERPDGHTLDRIDPFGDYEPGNCRWATPTQQANNQRRHHECRHR